MIEGFDLVTTQPASIILRGPPIIRSLQVCLSHNSILLFTKNRKNKIFILQEKTVGNFNFQSSIAIRSTEEEDFGYYGCAVTNGNGSDEVFIHLEMKGGC